MASNISAYMCDPVTSNGITRDRMTCLEKSRGSLRGRAQCLCHYSFIRLPQRGPCIKATHSKRSGMVRMRFGAAANLVTPISQRRRCHCAIDVCHMSSAHLKSINRAINQFTFSASCIWSDLAQTQVVSVIKADRQQSMRKAGYRGCHMIWALSSFYCIR